MKIGEVIIKLRDIREKHGNLDVIVDYDENGWYASEKIEVGTHKEEGEKDYKFVNFISSNEA